MYINVCKIVWDVIDPLCLQEIFVKCNEDPHTLTFAFFNCPKIFISLTKPIQIVTYWRLSNLSHFQYLQCILVVILFLRINPLI